jgi:putative oxidoreductase
MSAASHVTMPAEQSLFARAGDLIGLADRFPFWIVQLAARVAIWHVFWASAQTKLASWDTTILLFENEYALPVLPPEIAALLGTTVECGGSLLILFGLATRSAALALLGLVAVIQFVVYPGHWPEHLMWASLLLLLFSRGAGPISLDWLVRRILIGR